MFAACRYILEKGRQRQQGIPRGQPSRNYPVNQCNPQINIGRGINDLYRHSSPLAALPHLLLYKVVVVERHEGVIQQTRRKQFAKQFGRNTYLPRFSNINPQPIKRINYREGLTRRKDTNRNARILTASNPLPKTTNQANGKNVLIVTNRIPVLRNIRDSQAIASFPRGRPFT